MGYHLIVFAIPKKQVDKTSEVVSGVSIVIAVKNGSEMLIRHLPMILSQDYPAFEVIIVDDHSDISEKEMLEKSISNNSHITLIHLQDVTGKKQALSLGISSAKYNFILCTDADCYPTGRNWISSMMQYQNGRNMVLGFSPYEKKTGWLNLVIRFETLWTAIQYFGWANIGSPFMGVGRNMLYPKDVFLKINPYQDHQQVPYGDDDLWVQKSAPHLVVHPNLNPESFVYSIPADSWTLWFRQKHRHLSAGHQYNFRHWVKPGLYALALIGHWLLLPVLLLNCMNVWWYVIFMACLLYRWHRYFRWTRKLGDRDTLLWYPVLEVFYAIYLAGMGLVTILTKKKTWN
jgi:glycosyltransferase involved in cell wall biosynthesis